MSPKDKNKRKLIYQTLKEINVEDKVQLVETVDFITKRPRLELRNYHRMFTKFLMKLPDNDLDTELNILKMKVASGEFLKELE